MDFKNLMSKFKDKVAVFFTSRAYGFYVGAAAALITLVQMIMYCFAPMEAYNGAVIVFCVVGILAFVALSLFDCTAKLAPIALMMFDFSCIVGVARADGIVDYLSTQFFGGISLSVLPAALTGSIICFLLSFLTASAAIYMPQAKKKAQAVGGETDINDEQTEAEA